MHQKLLMIPVICTLLAGFSSISVAAEAQDAATSARIRVFKEAAVTLYPGEYCYGSNSPAAIQATEGETSIFSLNKKVGMPVTLDTPADYNEYVIAAGKPLTVMLKLEAVRDGVKASCGPLGATFYPQAGRNYDVTMGYAGSCFAQIRELLETSPGKAEARQFPSGASFPCAAK
jgi:hypothetical protein